MYPLQKLVELRTISNAYVHGVWNNVHHLGREHCAPMPSRKCKMQPRLPMHYSI